MIKWLIIRQQIGNTDFKWMDYADSTDVL